MEEAGGNPGALHQTGKNAAELANAMSGLKDSFFTILEGAKIAASEDDVQKGYSDFWSTYEENVREIEKQGLDIAENIDAAGAEIGRTDAEAEDSYSDAWPGRGSYMN